MKLDTLLTFLPCCCLEDEQTPNISTPRTAWSSIPPHSPSPYSLHNILLHTQGQSHPALHFWGERGRAAHDPPQNGWKSCHQNLFYQCQSGSIHYTALLTPSTQPCHAPKKNTLGGFRRQNSSPWQHLKAVTQRTNSPYLSNDVTVLSVHLGRGADVADHAQHLVNLGGTDNSHQHRNTPAGKATAHTPPGNRILHQEKEKEKHQSI